jgi:hypothetical protein
MLIGGSVAVSIGGAALIGMGVAIGIYQSALGELEAGCPNYENGACPSALEDTVSRGDSASIAVNVLAAIGAAGVGTGVILLVVDATSGGEQAPTTGQAALRPLVTPLPGGAFVGLDGSF